MAFFILEQLQFCQQWLNANVKRENCKYYETVYCIIVFIGVEKNSYKKKWGSNMSKSLSNSFLDKISSCGTFLVKFYQ